mmetsp:Transcript_6843/g.12051  ORF Transcript_6843/g.12051 Transcript_6843/m.12051 type:complete len:248 (-) Transcript_6843:13-756(-)
MHFPSMVKLLQLSALAHVASAVIVITEYYPDTSWCIGKPTKLEATDAVVQALMTFGPKATTCVDLPIIAARLTGSFSMNFEVENNTATCLVNHFYDASCQKLKVTKGMFADDCKPWKGRPGRTRSIQAFRLDVDDSVLPGGTSRSRCTDEAVPAGAFDKTCVTAEEYLALPRFEADPADHPELCFAQCLGYTGALFATRSREDYDAMIQPGGCAASCDDFGRTQVHKLLVSESLLDCNYQPYHEIIQ